MRNHKAKISDIAKVIVKAVVNSRSRIDEARGRKSYGSNSKQFHESKIDETPLKL